MISLSTQKLQKLSESLFLAAIFVLPFSIAALEILLAASFISWFAYKIIKREAVAAENKILLLVCFFLISSSVSAFYSGYPLLSMRGIVKIVKYTLIMLVAADLFRNPESLKKLLFVGLTGFVILMADSFFQRFDGRDLVNKVPIHYADKQIRLTGPYKFYGLLGAHLIAVLPLILSLTLAAWSSSNKKWKRFVMTCFLVLSGYLLYKTHSRGAWLAAFGSWLVFTILLRKKILIAALVLALLVVPFLLPQNALIHLDIERKEQSIVERYFLWDRALQVIRARPWFGCGINTYIHNYPKFDKTKSWRVPGYYAHNGYLQLAAETGLVSLSLFLFIIALSLSSGYRAFQKALPEKKILIAGLISGFVALLLQAFVDTTFHNLQPATLIWFMAGLLVAVGQPNQRFIS